jgi:hypothetical protein
MERFISNYDKFLEEVKNSLEKKVETCETDEEKLLFFVNNWYPHMNAVSEGKYDYFTDDINPNVFSNITFKELYDSSSDENKFVIWEYLQTLYALSVSLVKTREDLKDDVKDAIENFPALISNIVSFKKSKKEQKVPKLNKEFIEKSSIAKLAKEISEEIDAKEFLNLNEDMKNMSNPMEMMNSLFSGDNSNGIGKLMGAVSEKLKSKMDSGEIDNETLLKDATSMLGNLGGLGDNKNGPDLSNIMQMAQNLSSMSDLFEGQGRKKPSARKVRRKIKKKKNKK